MAERFGEVLYWFAAMVAAAAVIGAIYLWNYGQPPNNYFGGWFFMISGVGIWIIGRACKYILAGR